MKEDAISDVFVKVSIIIWLCSVRVSGNFSVYSRQRFGIEQSMSESIISRRSVMSLSICSKLCMQKGCKSFVYGSGGYCVLYDSFLRSLENYVDGLYAMKDVHSGSVCHARFFNTNLTNVALGKSVTMSSTYSDSGISGIGYAMLAVDGDRDPIWPCASTIHSVNPYLIVDLGQTYRIIGFYILNRSDCCPERLHHLKILVGDTLDGLKEVVYFEDPMSAECTFILPDPVSGRHVKLLIDSTSHLTLCELEVYSTD